MSKADTRILAAQIDCTKAEDDDTLALCLCVYVGVCFQCEDSACVN